MPVTNVATDTDNLTLTITAEFAATVDRVWGIYADPRKLEQVWGPPTYPATFVDHDLAPGGRVTYYMTSPEGEKYPGWWQILTVDEPKNFTFEDGFADQDFNPVQGMPVSRNDYTFTETGGATTAVYTSIYADADALQKVLDMGIVEGATESINQIDVFLAQG